LYRSPLIAEERVLLKTLPIQQVLRNASSPLSLRGAMADRRSGDRLPWPNAARYLFLLSIAGWGGLLLLWSLVF
jgi:hypothetical protein